MPAIPYTFANGTVADASQVNANFTALTSTPTGPATWIPGSVAFATSAAGLGQDNANLFWDDTNNRLGVGTAAPVAALSVSSGGVATQIQIHNSASGTAVTEGFQLALGGATANVWNYENGAIVFATNNVQQMAIDAVGRVQIGTFVSPRRLAVRAPGVSGATDYIAEFTNSNSTAGDGVVMVCGGPTGADTTTKLVWFLDGPIATPCGSITRNGAAAVLYNTTSDERLKSDIVESDRGLDALMALKVSEFRMQGDERATHGLVAQDVAAVYPEAVHVGGDDPVMEPWMLDYGRLTPLLIRTIQQQQAQIEKLEERLAALEGSH